MDMDMNRFSISSSIYSQDDIQYQQRQQYLKTKPDIRRMKSTSSSTSSVATAKTSTTTYSQEAIKALGYTPFEYWKGPLPVPSASQYPNTKKRRPPPPPPKTRQAVDSPIPEAKLRETREFVDLMSVEPPRSPRVKDRMHFRKHYQREARRQRLEDAPRWPGWVPDEKVIRAAGGGGGGKMSAWEEEKLALVDLQQSSYFHNGASPLERSKRKQRFWEPQAWGRHVWGILGAAITTMIVVIIIVAGLRTEGGTPMDASPKVTSRLVEPIWNFDFSPRDVVGHAHRGSLARTSLSKLRIPPG